LFDFLLCRLFTKTHFRRVISTMFIICLLYPLILWQAKIIWIYLLAMALWGLYYDLFSFGKLDFIGRYDKEEHSSSFGLITVFENLGYVIAPLIVGFVIFEIVDWRPYLLAWVFIIIAFVIYVIFLLQVRKIKIGDSGKACRKVNFFNEIKIWKRIGVFIWPLLVLSLVISMSEAIFWTIGPLFSENFAFHNFNGLFLTAYTLPPLLTGWFIGSFTSKMGKKRVGYLSFILGSLSLTLLTFTESPFAIIFVIFVSSFFISLSWPSIGGAYADYISESPNVEKEIEGVEDFFSNIGFVIGPILAGFLADRMEYARIFALFGLASAIITAAMMLVTPKKINININIDGVLVNSEALHLESELATCRNFSLDAPLWEWDNFRGRPAKYTFRYLIDKYGSSDIDIDDVIRFNYSIYLDLARRKVEPIAGALDFLKECKNHFGKVALTTSGRRASQQLIFDKFELHDYFDIVITGDDIENGKPHPEPYSKTVKALDLEPASCLVVEDSDNGIISAKAAGCMAAGLTTSFGKEKLESAGADIIFDDFSELLKIIRA
jgi:HAD superfamily hydrolase (TIGR01509 family)